MTNGFAALLPGVWLSCLNYNVVDMKFFTFAAAAAVLLTASRCAAPQESLPADGTETGYSISFFRTALSLSGKDDNVLLSPYSAGVALSMLADGAQGQTREEIMSALSGVTFSGGLVKSDSADVRSANSVWIRSGFDVHESYLDRMDSAYGAYAASLDFSDPASVDVINSWCSDNTEGRIESIVDNIGPDMVMFLVNALYFKAPWQKAFDAGATREDVFHGSVKESRVPFMSGKEKFRYAEYGGTQIVELPYAGGRYSMLVMLPAEGLSPDEVLGHVDSRTFCAAADSMSVRLVALEFPKFRMETSTVLNSTLASMGIRRAFTPSAELGGIAEGNLDVAEVLQKCFLEVSEEGSEAAAVTSIGVRLTSVRPGPVAVPMVVDRPFAFMITDTVDSHILFAGKVMNL